jgi:hypothetical protein
MATAAKSKNSRQPEKKSAPQLMVFKKQNYILLIASLAVIVLGFIIMGSGKDKPFDDPMKITVAPLIVLAGFALGVFSIMYTPKDQDNQEAASK